MKIKMRKWEKSFFCKNFWGRKSFYWFYIKLPSNFSRKSFMPFFFKLTLLLRFIWPKKNVRRATIIKLIPPAKSVSLSSWKIAAIKKKISWIVNIVIPVNFEDEEIRNDVNRSVDVSLVSRRRLLCVPSCIPLRFRGSFL